MLKKIALSGLGALLLVSPVIASADSVSDLQAQLQALLARLAQIQGQMNTSTSSGNSSTARAQACVSLLRDLSTDDGDADSNGEVTKLQQFLANDPSIYPEGRVTGYFGPATMRAVQRWQRAHGIVSSGDPDSTGFGYVGRKTRAAMACGSAATTALPSASVPGYGYASPQTQVQVKEITVGSGPEAVPGKKVSVQYVGSFQNGAVFDSSKLPLQFTVGDPGLIQGFQAGVNGMRPGGRRVVTIPPSLGYGSSDVKDGSGNIKIPANSTLVFDITLVNVENDGPALSAPDVTLLSPSTGYSVSRKGKMPISWKVSTDKRRIVTGTITLLNTSGNGRPVGSVSGTTFMRTAEVGTSYGTFEQDWGLNDSVPGTYTLTLALRDCSPKGCDQNPDYPSPGYGPVQTYATSQTLIFSVLDDDSRAPLSIDWRNKSFLLGTSLKRDVAQKLCDAAAVTIDSYNMVTCRWGTQILTSYGIKDGGDYISVTKPYPNEYLYKNNQVYAMEFLDRSGQTGDPYTVYFQSFSGSGVAEVYERTLSSVEKKSNGLTSASLPFFDLPTGDYYLNILNLATGAHGGVGATMFVR